MLIRLSDEDRKRYGIEDEWIGFDIFPITVKQAIALQDAGFHEPEELVDAWNAQFSDSDGEKPRVKLDFRVWEARVWLAVTKAGVAVSMADFDFDMTNARIAADLPEATEGKDDPSTPVKTSDD